MITTKISGGGKILNKSVVSPETIQAMQWDVIVISSMSAMKSIKKQLMEMGISEDRIDTSYVDSSVKAREIFVRDYAKIVYDNRIEGSVAEAGVFQGEFAAVINESFPNRKLYLFDTFEGFDERDIVYESQGKFSDATAGHLNLTSEELVMNKMKYSENVFIKKGYFPDTAKDIKECFCFVNLDMDLYKPTLEGLNFFYPLMVSGGIIVIHDYFLQGYEGINVALKQFLEHNQFVVPFPIGDGVSIAIQK